MTAQRRLVTLLFCDLCDSTGLSARLEPEEFADLLDWFRRVAQRVVPAHGGELVRVDGDGMLCLFGFPTAYEDAARRATEAAIDIRDALAALRSPLADRPLALHCAVHAGQVLFRAGDLVRGKYELLGDATNSAARIRDAAGPGEILVSAQSLGGHRHLFHCGPARGVKLRGHADAIACYPVLGRAAAQRPFDARVGAGLTPLAGRDAQIDTFGDWLAGCKALCFVHGPAGIGKSRLLQQFGQQAAAAGWRVATGYCEAYLGARPLQPFVQAGIALASKAAADPLELFGEFVSRTGLLLIIDDWQWADDASRDLLDRLLAAAPGLRFLLASRSPPAGFDAVTTLALPPLDAKSARDTIAALLPSPDPFIIARIEQATGGSPLLIEEYCHAVSAGRAQTELRGAWFDTAVQARFDRLTAPDRALLKLLAVIGHMIPTWLVVALTGGPLDAGQLDRLQAADFLFASADGAQLRFKHGLTRDALYAAVGMAERKALHARVLAALDHAERPAAELRDAMAYHALAAGEHALGLQLALAAGDAALAAGALDRAQAHYLASFAVVPALPDAGARRDAAWALINKYGLACIIDPAADQLLVLAQMAAILAETGSARDRMRAAYWQGAIAYGVGLGKTSVRHFDSALALARRCGSASDILLIEVKRAQSLFTSSRVLEAEVEHRRLLPILRATHTPDRRGMAAYAHTNCGLMYCERGDFDRAFACFDQAEAILQDAGDPANASIALNRATALIAQGHWRQALILTTEVLRLSGRVRARMQNRTARAQAAYAHWKLSGDPRHLADMLRSAEELFIPGTNRHHSSLELGWVVDALVAVGRVAEARRFMGQVLARAREGGDRLGEAMAWRAMALAAERAGDRRRADRRLAAAERSQARRPSRREAAHNQVCRARLLLARGQVREAAPLLAAAADAYAAMAMPCFRAEALSLLAAPATATG